MTSKFSIGTPTSKPPPYCKTFPSPLPPIIPPIGPPELQGWCHWLDLDPLGPTDVTIYCTMKRSGPPSVFVGSARDGTALLIMTLEIVGDPQPWRLTLDLWRTPSAHEGFAYPDFTMQLDPYWKTPLLTQITIPGMDRRDAQVML